MTRIDHYRCDICNEDYQLDETGSLTTNSIRIQTKWFALNKTIHICDTCMNTLGPNSIHDNDAAYKLNDSILNTLHELFRTRIRVPLLPSGAPS